MKKIFTDHPHSVGETYLQHLYFASLFGFKMVAGGMACLIHAVFPFVFEKTGSNYLLKMTEKYVLRMPHDEVRIKQFCECINEKVKPKQDDIA